MVVEDLKISVELIGWTIPPSVGEEQICVQIWRDRCASFVNGKNFSISGVSKNRALTKCFVEFRSSDVLFDSGSVVIQPHEFLIFVLVFNSFGF